MGTAGGLFHFRDRIEGENTNFFFVLHSDVCCSFPLKEVLEFHKKQHLEATMVGTEVNNNSYT